MQNAGNVNNPLPDAANGMVAPIFNGFHEWTFGKFLESADRVEIPNYQRAYEWDEATFGRLVQNILDSVAIGGQPSRPHFVGFLVVFRQAESQRTVNVVDGQQRTISLLLLVYIIRSLAKRSNDAQLERRIMSILSFNATSTGLGWLPRLRLQETSPNYQEVFETHIHKAPDLRVLGRISPAQPSTTTDFQKHLKDNIGHGMDLVEKFVESRGLSLNVILDSVMNTKMLVIETRDQASAYRVFTILNIQGVRLAPIDMIRARIYGEAERGDPALNAGTLRTTWGQIETQVLPKQRNEFFDHLYRLHLAQTQTASFEDFEASFAESVANGQSPAYAYFSGLTGIELFNLVREFAFHWATFMTPMSSTTIATIPNGLWHLESMFPWNAPAVYRSWVLLGLVLAKCTATSGNHGQGSVVALDRTQECHRIWPAVEKLIGRTYVAQSYKADRADKAERERRFLEVIWETLQVR